MLKKLLALAGALLLLFASNLNLSCRVTVNGVEMQERFAPSEVKRGFAAAEAAAEEILEKDAEKVGTVQSYSFSLRKPTGKAETISDALLCSLEGIAANSGVYVDGQRLGCVEEDWRLREKLQYYIDIQQPTKAVRSMLNGELEIIPFYTRSGHTTNYDDMILLITGMAPVMYMDENGKFV